MGFGHSRWWLNGISFFLNERLTMKLDHFMGARTRLTTRSVILPWLGHPGREKRLKTGNDGNMVDIYPLVSIQKKNYGKSKLFSGKSHDFYCHFR